MFETISYFGTTEEICIPMLDKESGLKYCVDFKISYFLECINSSKLTVMEKAC